MKTYAEQQLDFFTVMGSPTVEKDGLDKCCNLSESLIMEEVVNETLPALRRYQVNPSLENLVELADGIADSIYVLLHTANSLDIPIDAVWNEVHRSNMAKAGPGSWKREDGKIMKPEGWKPPDVHKIVMDYQTRQQYGDKYFTKGMVS